MTGAEGTIAMALSTPTKLVAQAGCSAVTASPRASEAVATTITATATIRVNQPASPGRNVSPSTTTPSTEPTTGSVTVIVGSDAVSDPARNEDCCQAVPAMATSTHAYSSGVRNNSKMPSSSRSTTPFVSTANRPHSAPDTSASRTALTGPDQMRAPITHSTIAGPSTAITAVHVSSDARLWPAVGLPTVTMTATEAARSAAHVHSHRVTRRCVIRAWIGSANSRDVTSSACTNSTEPKPNAAACSPNPAADTRLPSHHWPSRSSRMNRATWLTGSSVTSWAERWWMTS